MTRKLRLLALSAGLATLGILAIVAMGTRGGTSAQTPPATPGPGAVSPSWPNGGYGPGGMMGGGYGGGPGMMRGRTQAQAGAVTMPAAVQRAEQYLAQTGNSDLTFDEVEEYTSNFYVAVREQSTGSFAFELLIDHATGAVWREPGPDMMWNTKYGMMDGYAPGMMPGSDSGMMGGCGCGMMGGWGNGYGRATTTGTPTADTPVTAEQATSFAQTYLDTALPGTTAGDAHAFYGFRTIEVLQGGQMVGMLSVNGYSGAVWYHTWHGTFVQEWQRPSS